MGLEQPEEVGRVGGGVQLMLYSPGGRVRARGSVPPGGEQRRQEVFIPQEWEASCG